MKVLILNTFTFLFVQGIYISIVLFWKQFFYWFCFIFCWLYIHSLYQWWFTLKVRMLTCCIGQLWYLYLWEHILIKKVTITSWTIKHHQIGIWSLLFEATPIYLTRYYLITDILRCVYIFSFWCTCLYFWSFIHKVFVA